MKSIVDDLIECLPGRSVIYRAEPGAMLQHVAAGVLFLFGSLLAFVPSPDLSRLLYLVFVPLGLYPLVTLLAAPRVYRGRITNRATLYYRGRQTGFAIYAGKHKLRVPLWVWESVPIDTPVIAVFKPYRPKILLLLATDDSDAANHYFSGRSRG